MYRLASFQEFFQGGAKSVVMQISFLLLIFLLFSDQILGEAKSPKGGQTVSGGRPLPPMEESQPGDPKKVLRLINNRTKDFCLISEMFCTR